MWTILTEATNEYARLKIREAREGKDPIEAMLHHSHQTHARHNSWKDVNESEMKIFIAHLIVMGLVKKSRLEKYWCKDHFTATPFFGTYMSRNRFQNILWNLHVSSETDVNPQYGAPGHDALFKIRPFIEMLQRNFKYTYIPNKETSMDESCCPFKGRVRFKCYNKNKPNKFHIKMYMVSEADSGYVSGFEVYTGKGTHDISDDCQTQEESTRTTRIVLGLLQSLNQLDRGFHVYFDNYYNSPELIQELYKRKTHGCGTVRSNRKNLPKAVTEANLSKGESVFRRKEAMLAVKWRDKRDVTVLTSIHSANEVITNKKNYKGDAVIKPEAIFLYNRYMSGVDLSDQYLESYGFLRRTVKWWRKLFIHLFNMLILNGYVLNKKFGKSQMSHMVYREHIAQYLIKSALQKKTEPASYNLNPSAKDTPIRLAGKHFPSQIYAQHGCKRKRPSRACHACNFTQKQLSKFTHNGVNLKKKYTSYWCPLCETPLCIGRCFEFYHIKNDYRRPLLQTRLNGI